MLQGKVAVQPAVGAEPRASRSVRSFSFLRFKKAARATAPTTGTKRDAGTGFKAYALVSLLMTAIGVGAVWNGNKAYGPEMYGDGMATAADALTAGQNYAVFDLNLNIRNLRDQMMARMSKTPDVVILGASHWQEAHVDLIKNLTAYNAHIHRDYWEDLLGATDILVRHNRLPKTLIISIRDKQFTPVSARKDYLWEPGIPFYREMADRLGIEKESYWATFPYQRIRAMFSLSMLFDNFTRWYNADERPHATSERQFQGLDTLLPDGSIVWSLKHKALFTAERAEREANSFADASIASPPQIDGAGVAAFDKLLTYLKEQGTTVYLVHPPFNPVFYDRVQGTPYMEGLAKVDAVTQQLAAAHGLKIFGDFNPHKVGCDKTMYIDAEHSNAQCLAKVLDQFNALMAAKDGA